MKGLIGVMAVAGLGLTSLVAAAPAGATTSRAQPAEVTSSSVAWAACPDNDPVEGTRLQGLECGTLTVPLDYAHPHGTQITPALSRAKHTAPDSQYQGVVLLNRGGPGGHGRDLPTRFSRGALGLPLEVARQYDWIGFDPRGVGAGDPALVCDESYQDPGAPRPDYVPQSTAEENAWRALAKKFADDCGARYGAVLSHMGTQDWARDMDAIRVALGQQKINYYGYSYGTFLGAVYATMFPSHVRRMVLDSVVRPSGIWYDDNLDQDRAFEHNIKLFFAWIAKHDATYHLGTTGADAERAYYQARAQLKADPAGGTVGADEFDDVFLADGYRTNSWLAHAQALSDLVVKHDPAALLDNWGPPDFLGQNNYTVHDAVQCRDKQWPRNWSKWHHDNWQLYQQGYTFETWANAWYNAPCAYWPVDGGPAPQVGVNKGLPGILLFQATEDAATPYPGGVETHKLFPSSRLVVELGGHNHGISLNSNRDPCINAIATDYLASGALPPSKQGPDATCQAMPDPEPAATTPPTHG